VKRKGRSHPKDGVHVVIELSRRLNRRQAHRKTNSSVKRLLDDVGLGLDEGEGDIRVLRDELAVDVLEGELLIDTLLVILFREKWFANVAHPLSAGESTTTNQTMRHTKP
jgi:hypothetical protein